MKIFLLFLALILHSSLFAQTGWFQQSSGTANDIVDIQFINANLGFAIANNHETHESSLLKSTNGGTNWTSIFTSPAISLYSLRFFNENTGIISGGYGSLVYKTTNSGVSWITQQLPVLDTYKRLYYQSADTIYAVGSKTITRTTNSGNSWATYYNLTDAYWSDITFINQKTGITAGASLVRTTNSGVSWTVMSYFGVGVSNYGENNILICGYAGIYKSSNFGVTAAQVYSFPPGVIGGIYSIKHIDASTAIGVGNTGKILKSTNGGNNWFEQSSNVTNNLLRVTFINQETGWIGGDYGLILKTTTGGVTTTGFSQTNSETPEKFSLSQNYPNPFNPNTVISYQLPVAGNVWLKVYNALGNEIETLVYEKQNAGSYSVTFDGANLPSGIYFYKLISNQFQETRKMVLVK
ncbi:MAG: T9SS type A sorting domain-containing protein [Ignavibacteria bacterium]|nr:T9SS type A sorting domain-containing protein [Ignavibacteria bacterium]